MTSANDFWNEKVGDFQFNGNCDHKGRMFLSFRTLGNKRSNLDLLDNFVKSKDYLSNLIMILIIWQIPEGRISCDMAYVSTELL